MLRTLVIMEDNLSFKTKILISLSLNSLLEKKRDLPLPFWFLASCFPEKKNDEILNTLFKLESEGAIHKSFIGRTKYLSLLDKGMERLHGRMKYIDFLREKWDSRFRMVLFDIPESDRKIRDQCRNILVEMGCVCWQRSVFISPHSIEDKVLSEARKMGVAKEVNVMLVDSPMGIDREGWVWDLWKLWQINDSYNFFINRAMSLLEGKISSYKKWVLECQSLRFSYYTLLCNEPFLPPQLTGKVYLFEKADECYSLLGKKLVEVLERA